MNEQNERDDQRREREGEPLVAGDPAQLATEAVGEEDGRTVQKNQEPEEERPFGERLAAWLRRDAPAPTRDSKATEKTRGLVLLGVTAVGCFFLFFGLFTTDSDSTKTARTNGPSLGRPQQQAVNPETANRSAVPQLSVNPPANEETGDLTEKDVLGTMRNRGGTPLETTPALPVAPKAPPPVNLGQINFDDPALAEAYRRQGRVSPKRPPEVADFNQGSAQQPANQRPSAPAAPPAVPVVNNGESLRKSSLVFVRSSLGIPAPGVGVKPALERKATGLLPQGSVLVARLQHAVSSAAKVPVVAVIEYNYEQDGELIVPAGSKAYGELSQATPQGWVGIKFHTLEFPSGEKEEITGSALSMERGVLKGDVNGKNSGKKFLTRALTGMGTIAAYAVGGRGLGSSVNGIDSSILLRERLASNIAMAGEQEMAMLAYQQNIVVTVPANTRFYLVLHQAGVTHSGGQQDPVLPGRGIGAAGAALQQTGYQESFSTEEIKDLRQLRNEMRQMNQMLLNSQPLSPGRKIIETDGNPIGHLSPASTLEWMRNRLIWVCLSRIALMPPSFGSRPLRLNPLYWGGVGAACLGREVRYLVHRSSVSSGAEKSAWVVRCILACVFVVTEWWFLAIHGRMDTLLALGVSWGTVVVLPRPTARIPLACARLLAGVSTGACIARGMQWAIRAVPGLSAWELGLQVLWFAITVAFLIWAFASLFRSNRSAMASVGQSNAQSSSNANWRSIPKLTFKDVGGCGRAKDEIRLLAENRFGENKSGVVRNGVLLYGPQGTGKNLLAEAAAGEFRVNFYHVQCPQLLGTIIGSTTAEIRRVFEWAKDHRPIVLFLDEIDSLGSKKAVQGGGDSGGAGREYNMIVTQLMQAIDQHRNLDGLLIVAATNYLETLEPTLVRDGRFDAKLRLDLPDEDGRKEILAALLNQVRWRTHDLALLVRRTPGWSPARLKGLADRAVLLANGSPVEEAHLLAALEASGGNDSPNLEKVSWDDVVLPESVVHDLQTLLRLMAPGEAERLSLPAPSGLILIGAPGTGKTLTAKLIASQSRRSFYSISPSDVLSGVTGGSVKRLTEIFARAKENAPSILFFDEMDRLFPHIHGAIGQHDVQLVEQALIEISALNPENSVFLVGTTNYIDRVDPRILRGGRFSEKIEIGVPDDAGYRRLIVRYIGKARLATGVTPEVLIERVRGVAPADLEATIHAMKRVAMRRMTSPDAELPALLLEDLDEALVRVQPRF